MATLAALRIKVYAYLGTQQNDPFFPAEMLNDLLNEAYFERTFDIRKSNPNYMARVATLVDDGTDGRTYSMPLDFADYLDVRITDKDGKPLREFALEDANASPGADGFTLNGTDDSLTLQTLSGVEANATLYLMYTARPISLADDQDQPTLIPSEFHGLLAQDVAFVCYSMGGEQVVPPSFLRLWQDKEARFWNAISQRGTQATLTREGLTQTWPG